MKHPPLGDPLEFFPQAGPAPQTEVLRAGRRWGPALASSAEEEISGQVNQKLSVRGLSKVQGLCAPYPGCCWGKVGGQAPPCGILFLAKVWPERTCVRKGKCSL